jgi:hypothetical protein
MAFADLESFRRAWFGADVTGAGSWSYALISLPGVTTRYPERLLRMTGL